MLVAVMFLHPKHVHDHLVSGGQKSYYMRVNGAGMRDIGVNGVGQVLRPQLRSHE